MGAGGGAGRTAQELARNALAVDTNVGQGALILLQTRKKGFFWKTFMTQILSHFFS